MSALTKLEVLRQLSDRLRCPDLDDATYCKLLTVFAKLDGWFVKSTEIPSVNEPTGLELVLNEERKRRVRQ